ncbi:MAG: alpha/beta hydrolase [Novosphingobium sp.]|nr:alpha/beta hydrolase [Novosphingobium sp.]
MIRRIAFAFACLLAFAAAPAVARVVVYEEVIVEEFEVVDTGNERFVHASPAPVPKGIAAFGPFRVLDDSRAALVDVTDARSPDQFAAMLRAFPGIAAIEMIECPGTEDDRANLRLGEMIRARGLATHVPKGGSVRSGAVELFVAGARRTADPQAEFAVHAWMDDAGLQATDYGPDAGENRKYIAYYRKMGMSAGEAAAFYAMTNSVPFSDARWLTGAEMARWVRLDAPGGSARVSPSALDYLALLH